MIKIDGHKGFTVDEVLKCAPCHSYGEDVLQKLWDKRTHLTIVEVCALSIPMGDKNWFWKDVVSKTGMWPNSECESELESFISREDINWPFYLDAAENTPEELLALADYWQFGRN